MFSITTPLRVPNIRKLTSTQTKPQEFFEIATQLLLVSTQKVIHTPINPMPTISLDKFRTFNHPTPKRNPIITFFDLRRGLVIGIWRIRVLSDHKILRQDQALPENPRQNRL
jgi:hypothetical protein